MHPSKILGPDGCPIGFYLGLFEITSNDLFTIVEESRENGRILVAFNATFITLIPKVDKVKRIEDLRPISLSSCVYKLIAKIIGNMVNPILSSVISPK